jgi:hypothetical protein
LGIKARPKTRKKGNVVTEDEEEDVLMAKLAGDEEENYLRGTGAGCTFGVTDEYLIRFGGRGFSRMPPLADMRWAVVDEGGAARLRSIAGGIGGGLVDGRGKGRGNTVGL